MPTARYGVVGVIADISERKYAEELIEKRIVALTQPLDTFSIALENCSNAGIATHPGRLPGQAIRYNLSLH